METKHNGIVYTSKYGSKNKVYHLLYIQDDSEIYKEYVDMNSIGIIRNNNDHICAVLTMLTKLDTPCNDTYMCCDNRLPIKSYGFKYLGVLTDKRIDKLVKYINKENIPFKITKVEKIKYNKKKNTTSIIKEYSI